VLPLLLAFVAAAAAPCSARIMRSWAYQEMFDKADLVVVAEGVSTKDTEERSTLTDVHPNVPVIGVTTEFKTRLVLKGSHDVNTFHLHHYRFSDEKDELAADAPDLVRLSERHLPFLMFLVRESDGRYAPVSGQTDPASFSVVELCGGAQ
jgi:hypothetical protein